GRDQKLIHRHKRELVSVILQRHCCQGGSLLIEVVMLENGPDYRRLQDDQTSSRGDHQQQTQTKTKLQGCFELLRISLPHMSRERGQDRERERGSNQSYRELDQGSCQLHSGKIGLATMGMHKGRAGRTCRQELIKKYQPHTDQKTKRNGRVELENTPERRMLQIEHKHIAKTLIAHPWNE